MGKKNTNFTLGLSRDELKNKALELGMQSNVNKASTKRLENFIKNNSNGAGKRVDTNFQFGIQRPELKRLATELGMKSDVNRASTKRLESFIQNNLIGKGKGKIPLTHEMKRDVIGMFNTDFRKGKVYLAEKLARESGTNYDKLENALRYEIEKQFAVFYEGVITQEMIDELMYRTGNDTSTERFNKLRNTLQYLDVFEEYAKELEEENLEDEL